MKRALLLLFGIVVLSVISSSPVLAVEASPVPASPEVTSVEPTVPAVALPLEGAIFLSSADDTAYAACCQGNFAICAASCAADVKSFSCTRVGARGCDSSCACN